MKWSVDQERRKHWMKGKNKNRHKQNNWLKIVGPSIKNKYLNDIFQKKRNSAKNETTQQKYYNWYKRICWSLWNCKSSFLWNPWKQKRWLNKMLIGKSLLPTNCSWQSENFGRIWYIWLAIIGIFSESLEVLE